MNARENVLEVINWGKPEYIPMTYEATHTCGFGVDSLIDIAMTGGEDAFGVNWIVTPEGGIPDNTKFVLDDVTKWREVIKWPDVEQYRTTAMAVAAAEMDGVDREAKLIDCYTANGIFDRFVSFMGYENALISMYTEPEECEALFERIAQFKIDFNNLIIDAYQPDLLTYCDDLATERSLFMAPDVYRTLIKPHHAKIVKTVNDRGVIFKQHTCGKCEDLLDDYVELGITMWTSAQIMNDLPGIQKKYKGKLVIEGGWDSSGACSFLSASTDDLKAEMRRCIYDYGKNGGFIVLPIVMNERGNSVIVGDDRIPDLIDEWSKHCKL